MYSELIIRSILLGVGLAMDAFSVSIADGLSELNMKKRKMFLIAGTFAAFQIIMPMTGWWLVTTAVDKFRVLEKYIPWIALLLLLFIGGEMLVDGIRELRHPAEKDSPEASGAAAAGRVTAAAADTTGMAGTEAAGTGTADMAGRGTAGVTDTAGMAGTEAAAGVTGTGTTAGTGTVLGLGALFIQGVATSIDALSVGFTIEGYGIAEAAGSSLIIGVVTLFICLAGLMLGRKIGTRLNGKAGILGGTILIAIGLEIWIKGVFF